MTHILIISQTLASIIIHVTLHTAQVTYVSVLELSHYVNREMHI